MSYEHPTSSGLVRLTKVGSGWVVRFVGKKRGRWRSPDAAAYAGRASARRLGAHDLGNLAAVTIPLRGKERMISEL
jgi:hypothetical protein